MKKTIKLVSLISGGIDSPVASYEMLKKGYEIIFVHFHNETSTKEQVRNKVAELVRILSKYQDETKLYLIPFQGIQKEIIKTTPAKYRMIIYRRMMFKIAENIIEKEKCDGFVTGDNLGQVASQTADNLSIILSATKKTVATPLVGADKTETMKKAREIGTYEESIKPYEDCCTFLNAKHPETRAKKEDIEEIEKNIKAEKAIAKALKEKETINFDK